jgi:hypothetical protein
MNIKIEEILQGFRDGIPIARQPYCKPAYTYSAALVSTLFWASGCAAGIVALLVGIIAAWRRLGLFPVAAICCAIVYLMDSVM